MDKNGDVIVLTVRTEMKGSDVKNVKRSLCFPLSCHRDLWGKALRFGGEGEADFRIMPSHSTETRYKGS